MPDRFISIYIHIPFCRTRCRYCDFNTYAGCEHLIDLYVSALKDEIEKVSSSIKDGHIAGTIYFGGGTPTILNEKQLSNILQTLRNNFKLTGDIEVTTEANPQKIQAQYLEDLRSEGINRISFGMQSAVKSELEILGRNRKFSDVKESLERARSAGFQNINLDLIFGIPTQTLSSWKETLERAIALEPEHLSLYSLILEENTPIHRDIQDGKLSPTDSDMEAEMYAHAMDYLEGAGFNQYEISNWAKSGDYQCRHNLQYWRNGPYFGFGAGAHSHYSHMRWANETSIPQYIHRILENSGSTPAAVEIQKLDKMDEIRETIMMGLRLTKEGIVANCFNDRFSTEISDLFGSEIKDLTDKGLIEEYSTEKKKGIRLTRRGRMLGNQVFLQFMD